MAVEGLIMPLQHSDVPEGVLLKLINNSNKKSEVQDGECDFVCALLEVLKMEGQIVASGELKPFSFTLVHITV